MDLDILSGFGWREVLMVIVFLLAVYMAFVYLRMRHLRLKEAAALSLPQVLSPTSALAAYRAEQAPAPVSAPAPESPPPMGELGTPEFQFPWNEPPGENPLEQRIALIDAELDQLRKEVGGMRAEILVLRETVRRQEAVPEAEPVREEPRQSVTQAIAPQYSEALQLALKDVDAAVISQQCGITRAEAELVAALVKNRDN